LISDEYPAFVNDGPKNGLRLLLLNTASVQVAVVLCRGESSVKLGDLEEQFAANVASFDHPMRKRSILEWKLMDGRYVDQSSVNLVT
jgi:hypothetical protein